MIANLLYYLLMHILWFHYRYALLSNSIMFNFWEIKLISTMKRKLRLWWLTIPPISTKRIITSHIHSLNNKWKDHDTFTLEIQILTWHRHTNMAGLNWSMASQSSPLDNWISNANISTKRPHTVKNESQQKHGQYNTRSMNAHS